MTGLVRGLTNSFQQFNIRRLMLIHPLRVFIILPVSAFFCLTMFACGVQEDASVGSVESPSGSTSVVSTQENVSSLITQETSSQGHESPRIVAFGDSLTAGLGVSPEDAYPSQLARWLRAKGYPYEVINAGVSGDTTAGGLRRVDWILKTRPTLVIVELGANDGLRGQPLQDTFNNLNAIIEKLKGQGVLVVLAGMHLPLNYGDAYTQEFTDVFVRLAQDHNISYIPFFLEGVATKRHLNQGDGLHPNAEGYAVVVQNVWRTLEPVLKEIEMAQK